MTIVRIWRSVTLTTRAEQNLKYLNEILIAVYRTAEGNEGPFVLRDLHG